MRAGRLRDRVTFQTEANTPDGAGGNTTQWQPMFGPVWGELVEERGRERVEGGRLAAPFSAVLRVRSSPSTRTVTEACRAVIDGVAWNIRSIANPDRRGRMLEMTVERGVAT